MCREIKPRCTIDLDGFTHMPQEIFKKKLDNWMQQIEVGLGPEATYHDKMMYGEISNWLDKNVAIEYDEKDYMHKIHVRLTPDGVVEILE